MGCRDKLPWQEAADLPPDEYSVRCDAKVEIIEDIREWDYGDYEGLTSQQIQKQREEKGQGSWDIWRDGCPGGEYVSFTFPLRFSQRLCIDWRANYRQVTHGHHNPPRPPHRRHPQYIPQPSNRQANIRRRRPSQRCLARCAWAHTACLRDEVDWEGFDGGHKFNSRRYAAHSTLLAYGADGV